MGNKVFRGLSLVATFLCALCLGAETIASSGDYKSMVDKKTWIDLTMRYQPYTSLKERLVRMFLR